MSRYAAVLRSARMRKATLWSLAAGALALVAIFALNPELARITGTQATDNLRTVKATRGSLEVTAVATGTFQPLEYVDVGAQLSGQLKAVTVKLGDVVRRGQLIAEIDDTTVRARLVQTEASLASVHAQITAKQAQVLLAHSNRDRNTDLVRRGFVSVATQGFTAALSNSGHEQSGAEVGSQAVANLTGGLTPSFAARRA